MIDKTIRDKYQPSIGIECHVQLKTATKLFAAVGNDARETPPNSLVSHICFGLPGALPFLNEEAINLAIKAAFALGSVPEKYSQFDRKHYFYPDLPKGYQITQYENPIIAAGSIDVELETGTKTIRINRAHLEEDAGKSTHLAGKDYSLVDLNRAGTPLLEIVSEPDMHSATEAKAYARELYLRVKYAGVSDANLYYGNMRFDVNVSVSTNPAKLGTRSETKNLNSFRSVEKAIEYEVDRQIELLEKGQTIVQETRGWDEAKQRTFSQRSKEEANDYRYFPEPDLPPVTLSDEQINKIGASMPIMPAQWRERLSELGLGKSRIETLLDAEVEKDNVGYLSFIEANLSDKDYAMFIANWQINLEIPMRRKELVAESITSELRSQVFSETYRLMQAGQLSSSRAKDLIADLLKEGLVGTDAETIARTKGYLQVSNEAEILEIVKQVLGEQPQAVTDYNQGKAKVMGFLVGSVMAASKGKANPAVVQQLIIQQLESTKPEASS